ncbi:hypothetical protein HW555_001579 [Spodoptera exigua]|uniref:Insulin-like polypeptide AB n=1 Tax=Spodoptera exigua TaxID=7107 RepID=A0A385H8W4_SPOEX|nr:insulin-like precursor polypeptide AB [Spodoptera exigua]KAF9422795.1 hypothetical protein HW555_001579 [Spodoptera exigua]
MKLVLVLVVLVACVWCCEAQGGNFYCGPALAEAWSKVCASSKDEKRGAGWWMAANEARSLGGFRGKRGLVNECCFKRCSLDELLAYCY